MTLFKKSGKAEMKLNEVSDALYKLRLPIALVVTPTNLEEEKLKFLQSDDYNPYFKYKVVNNSNSDILNHLSSLKLITDVDPRISDFYIKLIEAKSQANDLMHAVGDNVKFSKIGIKRFKRPSPILFRNACRILRGYTKSYNLVEESKRTNGRKLYYEDIVQIWREVFDVYGLDEWGVQKSMNIAKNGIKVGVKRREVLMDENIVKSPLALKKSIIHEMTHIIRAVNGLNTGVDALSRPNIPSYLDVEEGLASYNEESMGVMKLKDLKNIAAKAWLVNIGRELSFREMYNIALSQFPKRTAFDVVYKLKRGLSDTSMPGIYPKGVVYFRGFRRVRNKINKDATIYNKLYAGKIGFGQVRWVDEGLIPKPSLLPKKELFEKAFKSAGL